MRIEAVTPFKQVTLEDDFEVPAQPLPNDRIGLPSSS